MDNCKHGWHDGSCCCNCKNQLKLMKHPWNKEFGKGSISEQCGWVCIVKFDCDNLYEGVFFDKEHGMCEMHFKKDEINNVKPKNELPCGKGQNIA